MVEFRDTCEEGGFDSLMEEYLGKLIIASRSRNVVAVIWSSKKEFT